MQNAKIFFFFISRLLKLTKLPTLMLLPETSNRFGTYLFLLDFRQKVFIFQKAKLKSILIQKWLSVVFAKTHSP